MKEYNACLIFNQKQNLNNDEELTNKKLLKRCEIVIKYLKNIQTSISVILDDTNCKLHIMILKKQNFLKIIKEFSVLNIIKFK